MLKYYITFNKELYIKQTELTLPYLFNQEQRQIKRFLLHATICFLAGLAILIAGYEAGIMFTITSLLLFFTWYNKNENYRDKKNRYLRSTRSSLTDEAANYSVTLEFHKHSFRSIHSNFCSWTNWEDFKAYKVKNQHLMMISSNTFEMPYVLSESEIGKIEFKKVINFVASKINHK